MTLFCPDSLEPILNAGVSPRSSAEPLALLPEHPILGHAIALPAYCSVAARELRTTGSLQGSGAAGQARLAVSAGSAPRC
jgi:hypothetical protein